ncbi:ester cyclase [Bremerella sp. T1]|uniref:ester cyclase n=1 Tax=Bremerella sp. TYQ1 TaxID=3119568 RepID=UPI001CCF0BC2|nr:ester cyclase [Bremerella volcania]UBM34526.1 ester cyclase [Bremerella volcania]
MSQLTELAATWFEEVWNQRNDAAIYDLSGKNARGYAESDVRYFSMDAFKQFRDNVLAAMPDLQIEVEGIIEQHPDVAVRWFLTGTHTGDGFGFPPTRSRVSIRGMTWLRVDENNKFVEGWDCWNQGRMMQIFVGAAQGAPGPDEEDA